MVTGGQDPGGEYENLQLTTLQGWRQFVAEMRSVPQLLAGPVWSGLEEDKRAAYDDERVDHHSRLLVVQTPTIREVINSGRRLIQLNKTARYGRCGLIVSGPARTGKTTALAQLGKTIEVIHRRRHPRSASDVPVVYITVPPAATPKMIAMEFARFFGLPLSRRANITDITEAVCGVCLDTRVTLVEVDELHNLNTATRSGAEASDTLKYFSDASPRPSSTPGISLERTGLLSGTRGEQIAGRFRIVRTGPFGRGRQWTALIAALEDSLRLHHHRPGTLDPAGRLPAPAHRRNDRQPALADPQRRHQRRRWTAPRRSPGRPWNRSTLTSRPRPAARTGDDMPASRNPRRRRTLPPRPRRQGRQDAVAPGSRPGQALARRRMASQLNRPAACDEARPPSGPTSRGTASPANAPLVATPSCRSPTTAAAASPTTRTWAPGHCSPR